jgi:hypothetical protein
MSTRDYVGNKVAVGQMATVAGAVIASISGSGDTATITLTLASGGSINVKRTDLCVAPTL